jgi:hypothetical protein
LVACNPVAGKENAIVAIGCARSTAQYCVRHCRETGTAWPLLAELTEETLYARLYHRQVPLSKTPAPDFARLHAELKPRGVTRMLLWQEYKAAQSDGSHRSRGIDALNFLRPGFRPGFRRAHGADTKAISGTARSDGCGSMKTWGNLRL